MALAVATADDVSNDATMSAAGSTYLTCRTKLTMSVDRGKADFALGRVEVPV
jgi:hypothetical protein